MLVNKNNCSDLNYILPSNYLSKYIRSYLYIMISSFFHFNIETRNKYYIFIRLNYP